jgi:outer membrane biosynthesis protein TonB
MSNRLPYDWFRDGGTSATIWTIIFSAVLHALLLGIIFIGFSLKKPVEPKLINVSLVAAPGPMTPMPGSAGAQPPPRPPEQPGPEPAPPEPPKPEPPKPEPPKPEPPKPEPKPDKPKPEPKPDKPPKPTTKEVEKPKKPRPVDLKPVADPKDEPPKKTPQKGGKPTPKLAASEPSDDMNVMPTDQPISMAVGTGGQGPPTAMGSWPGLLQRQVYLQWVVPNGIPMNDANYLPQITVTIGRDGRIMDRPQVTKPSPSPALDDSCVQALVNATLPPFPDNYEEPSITLVVQFSPMGRQAMGGMAQP